MTDCKEIRYNKDFLNQVIFRVDFMNYVPSEIIFDGEIEKTILQFFPRREKDRIIRFNSIDVVINNSNSDNNFNAQSQYVDGLQKEFRSLDGQNKVIVTNKFCVFEVNKYSSFEDFNDKIKSIMLKFFSKSKITLTRTGLRYINVYDADKIKLQKNYFIQEIAAKLITKSRETNDFCLMRAMSLDEYRIENGLLNFRYGLFNPDYPNDLNKNSFALDFDFYTQDIFEAFDDVIRFVEKGHNCIQNMFENSITDSMRKVMNCER